ncbi:cytochrome b560 subunit of succinate dehydrogenase [Hyaloscypha variabilis F]|uniref:Cytochrome b560 subunit of succinate dehydrogenase n=1 Tax=Hyaloscypha variabilis (strain UAMH 11265 / GT02V1 / F) TaxID=1149755 RepID=A0A2J6S8S9_HYAVF|nr:cytochrome b560 subunit of succinate dehydrogenase [Hyaloscypha variabilis F]
MSARSTHAQSPSSRNLRFAIDSLQMKGKSTHRTARQQILAEQRKKRPVSPHLAIYRMQINYFTSPLNRITGSILSGGLYCFGAAYLVSPLFGWHLDTATLVAAFGSLPLAVKIAAKATMAFQLTFHGINGVGHLVWDTGSRFQRKQIVSQGWTILGLSVASAVYLVVAL